MGLGEGAGLDAFYSQPHNQTTRKTGSQNGMPAKEKRPLLLFSHLFILIDTYYIVILYSCIKILPVYLHYLFIKSMSYLITKWASATCIFAR